MQQKIKRECWKRKEEKFWKLFYKHDCITLQKKKGLLWPCSTFSSKTVLRHSCPTKRQKAATCDLKGHFHVSVLLFAGQRSVQNFFKKIILSFLLSVALSYWLLMFPPIKEETKRDRQILKKISPFCSAHFKYTAFLYNSSSEAWMWKTVRTPCALCRQPEAPGRTSQAPTDSGNLDKKVVGSYLTPL